MQYTTEGSGMVACDQGQDVVYPAGAPGFQDDPTGASLQDPASQACPNFSARRMQLACLL